MILLALAIASSCIAVDGDRIRAADLAAVVPEFASLPPETILAYGPVPGARRTLMSGEIERWATRHGLTLASHTGFCVERTAAVLTAERVTEALRTAVNNESAKIELLGFSKLPVPPGELVFPRSGYTAPLSHLAPAVWRGRLKYGENRSLPVWARVRITVPGKRLVAAEDLKAGAPIQPSQVRVDESPLPLFADPGIASQDQVAGRVPRMAIRAGAVITAVLLTVPPDIARGETVTVQVVSGAAQLSFQAEAESSGRKGDLILLRNPESGKRFQARVEGQGKAILDAKQMSAAGGSVPDGGRSPGRNKGAEKPEAAAGNSAGRVRTAGE